MSEPLVAGEDEMSEAEETSSDVEAAGSVVVGAVVGAVDELDELGEVEAELEELLETVTEPEVAGVVDELEELLDAVAESDFVAAEVEEVFVDEVVAVVLLILVDELLDIVLTVVNVDFCVDFVEVEVA